MFTWATAALTILLLAFVQNVSFTLTSRSRNRDNQTYHLIAAIGSNGIWFLTFRQLILADMSFALIIPYIVGTVAGSLFGVKVAMKVESWIGATADGHVKREEPAKIQPDLKLKEFVPNFRLSECEVCNKEMMPCAPRPQPNPFNAKYVCKTCWESRQ